MKDYLTDSTELFESFGEKIISSANTPEKKDLIEKDSEEMYGLLMDDKAYVFIT